MTRRFLLLMLVAGLVIAVLGAGAASAKDGRASVNLYERTDDGSWSIVDDGAWGKLRYWPNGDAYDFKFKGYGLEKWTDYTLIYYPDPWPGDGLVCLGEDYSNRRGKVHIRDWIEPENLPLPMADDENFPDGAKIWLVLSADVKCDTQQMTSWNPTEYLFEEELIWLPKRFIDLYQKTEDASGVWTIVGDGAWGKLDYRDYGDEYRFRIRAFELVKGTDYTLIYYSDPWADHSAVCFGDDTANRRGRIYIRAWVDANVIPSGDDANYPGAKMWLVLSDDVDCDTEKMIGWNPAEYLFENELLYFPK